MILIVWFVVVVGLGVAVAIVTRGVPRVLALCALALVLLKLGFSWWVLPLLFDSVGSPAAAGLVSGIVGVGHSIIVLTLFVAAAAIATRQKPVAAVAPGGLR